MIAEERFLESFRRKIGPADVCRPQFRISNLPEQEIAHPEVTARADQKIRSRDAPCIEMVLK